MAFGPELLTNGDFSASTGIGGTSSIGPGWVSSYLPCGPSLFAGPCGQSCFAFFTTNAGQVTGGFGAAIPVLGTRSMAVNVGANTAIPIIEWLNIPLVSGQRYHLQVNAAIMSNPFSVAMKIGGGAQGIFPIPAPPTTLAWYLTTTEFVFAGPTGNYPVGLYSNSGAASGNDHTFDDFSLRAITGAPIPCGCCPVSLCGIGTPSAPTFLRTLDAAGRTDVTANGPFIFTNFAGSGVDVTFSATLPGSLTGSPTGLNSLPVGTLRPMNVSFSQPVYLRQFTVNDLDNNSESVNFLSVPYNSLVGGAGSGICAGQNSISPRTCARGTVNNSNTVIKWAGPLVSNLNFTMNGPAGLGEFFIDFGFDLVPPVYVSPCRTADGVLHWYAEDGTEVATADVAPCENPGTNTFIAPVPTPLAMTNLTMNTTAWGDDGVGNTGEQACNVVPAPTSMVGFTPVGALPGCLEPSLAAGNSLTWLGPVSSVEMTYNSNGGTATGGAALFSFTSPATGVVQWPANATPMLPGQSRNSSPMVGGGYARLTYVGGEPGIPIAGAPRFDGAGVIRIGSNPPGNQPQSNYRFRVEFFA